MESDTVGVNTELSKNDGPNLEPGTVIQSRFRVQELLGQGGMGSVYLVKDTMTGSEYALKCLSKQNTNDATWRRFDIEAKAVQKLEHPNLIKLHESGLLPDGQPYFIMDLVQGETLADALKKRGRLDVKQAIKIFIQVGFALGFAHSKGIIHRDIKPSNIMIEKRGKDGTLEGTIKLVDFGIAKLTGQDEFNQQTLTRTGEVFGSPLYMSPEQCLGTGVDFRSDLYSLGCVFYESLTGAPPHVGENALSTMLKHQSERPVSLKEASMGIEFPIELERIAAKLLEKNPQDRYETALSLSDDLVKLEQSLSSDQAQDKKSPITHSLSTSANFKEWKSPLILLISILIFATGFFFGYFYARIQPSQFQKPTIFQPVSQVNDLHPTNSEKTAEERGKAIFDQLEKEYKTRKFSTPSKDKNNVVFQFPKSCSLGVFTVRKAFNGASQLRHFEARGTIVIPRKAFKLFTPSFELKNHPALFSMFGRDDINCLDFRGQNAMERALDCEDADVDAILPNITQIKGLEVIIFDNTSLSDKNLLLLDEFPKLDSLLLGNTRVSGQGVSKLNVLRQLQYLKIKGMKDIGQVVDQLKNMKNLQILILGNCMLHKDDIEKIGSLKSLNEIRLVHVRGVTAECLDSFLPSLKILELTGCDITPRALDRLSRLKNLKQLYLPKSLWTKPELEKLKSLMPRTEVSIAGFQ